MHDASSTYWQVGTDDPGVGGLWVRRVGAEVFRLCDTLVDDVILVTPAEISAALREAFDDTRAMLEPAGGMSIAGLKQYLEARPKLRDSDGTYVAIASDASNIEFETVQSFAAPSAPDE